MEQHSTTLFKLTLLHSLLGIQFQSALLVLQFVLHDKREELLSDGHQIFLESRILSFECS